MKKIEFIGLSGSGKSTAIKILEKYLHSQCIFFKKGEDAIKISIIKKIIHLLSFCIKNFELTYFILKEILKRKDKIFILKRFLKIFYSYEHFRDKGFTLFDEGFVFLGYYFHVNFHDKNGLSEKKLQRYISKIPKPDYLIYIKTNLETAMKRMLERGVIHSLTNHNDEQLKNYYFNSFVYFEQAAKELEKIGVEVIRIHNEEDCSCLEKKLYEIFKEMKL